jgi:hypothetical protein
MEVGQQSKGTFTAFWDAWWEGEGEEIIDKYIDQRVRTDANYQYTRLRNRGGTVMDPKSATASMHRWRAEKQMEVAAAMRRSAARIPQTRRV